MCLSSLETEAISKYTPSLIKVLHVDDDAAFLETSKLCLEIQGHFEIKVALSPHDAMEKLKQEEFDVVISDYQMPGKNGLEFLIDLRASGNNVPFILFTGKVREEVAVKALNLGAFRYVDKRGDPETVYSELSTGIHQSFEQRQAREQLKESEEWFKAIHDQQQTGIVIVNPVTHRIVNANAAAEEMIGACREQLIGKECHDCFCPSERGKCPVTDLGQTVNKSCRVLVRMDPEGTTSNSQSC